MGPPGGVVDPLTGLRIDDDEDKDDAAKGRRSAKAEKPRRRKGKPSDAADAGGGHAGKPDASKPKPRGRQKRGGASSDDDERGSGDAEEEGARRGGKGKARDKHHKSHAPRPGQIGFEGLDDGGRSQSLYKGMSRGAVKKALERDAAEATRAAAPLPLEAPEVTTPIFDACAHLARVAETARESNLSRAWAAGDPAALACAPVGAVVNVTCDVEALDPAYGASAYRAWERLFGDEGEDETPAGVPFRREDVYHAFGVHPSRAAETDTAALVARVARFSRETRAVAVGVCGCDFRSADEDARSAQLEVLAGCMAVARGEVDAAGTDDRETTERRAFSTSDENENENENASEETQKNTTRVAPRDGAPATPATPLAVLLVSLGGDDADDAVVAAFAKHRETCVAAGASTVPAVFLDPSPRLASAALATFPDALVSVSGAVTHAKNVSLLEVAFDVPLDRIALASEAPGKMPTQLVGRQRRAAAGGGKPRGGGGGGAHAREWSHPASLAFAAEKVAQVKGRGIAAEDVVAAAARNARRAFLGTPE